MSDLRRIAIMVVVSEIMLMIMAGGFNVQVMLVASPFIIVFCTLPLILIIWHFHSVEKRLGKTGTVSIAAVGLLPTLFVFVIAPTIGVRGGFNTYAGTLCVAGWLWSAAWLRTSQWRITAQQ
jgi:hypothetical protein